MLSTNATLGDVEIKGDNESYDNASLYTGQLRGGRLEEFDPGILLARAIQALFSSGKTYLEEEARYILLGFDIDMYKLIDILATTESTSTVDEPLQEALVILFETVQEASTLNWDGYNARPVSEPGYYKAKQFLESLPASIPMPEIGVDPDGEVSFDWYSGASNIFTVSVSGTGRLAFAGIFGRSKVHGEEYFTDQIPRFILVNLQRLWDGEMNY